MYDQKEIEKKIAELWKKEDVPNKVRTRNPKGKKCYVLDGPPYTTGEPHVGHLRTTLAKDLWIKLRMMQGHNVRIQPGFDCNGLPIENKVELELGVKCKSDIEKIGVDKFMKTCEQYAEGNIPKWLDVYKRFAAWVGWVEPYKTYKNYYHESGWWTIKQIYDKGFLIPGEKPLYWCPHCETAISAFEAQDSYKDVTDPAVYVKFPLKEKEKEYLVIFTTTPWTFPANVAAAVHPDEKYVRVNANGEVLILAEKLLKDVMKKAKVSNYKVLETFQGKKLEGTKYLPALDIPLQKGLEKEAKAQKVILSVPILLKKGAGKTAVKTGSDAKAEFGHLVTMDVGTGIVHIAPGHGQEDNRIGAHYGLPVVSPVKEDGTFEDDAGEFKGLFVKDADKKIIKYLKKRGLLLYSEQITHSYPLCWRCKSPLIFRMSKQWFFKIDAIKQKMLDANSKINWMPDFARVRMHNWLEDAEDWAFSTQRYWGISIPIWVCEDCGKTKVIGSRKELQKEAIEKIPNDVDLHKNTVDKIHIKCQCGKTMSRIRDTANVWFDSGIAPWASMGYPFQNKDVFEKFWPADQISESQDQVRAWFYHMLFMGMITFDETPFKAASVTGWVLDKKGEKMSKSLGNVISAEAAIDELGTDVVRFYYCYDTASWDTQKFNKDSAREINRILNSLWNVKEFYNSYGGTKEEKITPARLKKEDKWILSRANTLTKEYTEHLEKFEWHFAGRKLAEFILNDFSRWYIKLVRARVSTSYKGDDKENVFAVSAYILRKIALLLTPVCPFMSEAIFQEMKTSGTKEKSVHFCKWPEYDKEYVNSALEKDMDVAKNIVEASNSARQDNDLKLRWPLRKITISGEKDVLASAKNSKEILKFMANVLDVNFGTLKLEVMAKPNYKVLGPAFGKKAKEAALLIEKIDSKKIQELSSKGTLSLGSVKITKDMVLIKESIPEGVAGKTFEDGSVYLDSTRDNEMLEEATIRELIRHVQIIRKDTGLDVKKRINISLSGDNGFIAKNKEKIEAGTNSTITSGCKKKQSTFKFEEMSIDVFF